MLWSTKNIFGDLSLALFIFAVATIVCTPAFCQGEKVFPTTKRILHFPAGKSLGTVIVGNERTVFGRFGRYTRVSGAVGDITISVPEGLHVIFEANHRIFENPELLDKISPAGLDGLKLGFISLDDKEDDMCDRALSHIGHFQGISEVDVDRSEATDTGLSYLKSVPSLVSITCFLSSVTGTCFKDLATLPNLRSLFLSKCNLDPKNLTYLASFPKLQYLDLDRTQLDERGARAVANCSHLIQLSVRSNHNFNDICLAHLRSLKTLQFLDLRDTPVTADGIKVLHDLKIKRLIVPSSQQAHIPALRKVFPKANIFTGTEKPVLNDKDMQLYEPLH